MKKMIMFVASLVGVIACTGPAGDPGEKGELGEPGPSGYQGLQGTSGQSGNAHDSGIKGVRYAYYSFTPKDVVGERTLAYLNCPDNAVMFSGGCHVLNADVTGSYPSPSTDGIVYWQCAARQTNSAVVGKLWVYLICEK